MAKKIACLVILIVLTPLAITLMNGCTGITEAIKDVPEVDKFLSFWAIFVSGVLIGRAVDDLFDGK